MARTRPKLKETTPGDFWWELLAIPRVTSHVTMESPLLAPRDQVMIYGHCLRDFSFLSERVPRNLIIATLLCSRLIILRQTVVTFSLKSKQLLLLAIACRGNAICDTTWPNHRQSVVDSRLVHPSVSLESTISSSPNLVCWISEEINITSVLISPAIIGGFNEAYRPA